MIDWDLIKKKLAGTTSLEEEARIGQWLLTDEKNRELLQELMERWRRKDGNQGRHYDTETAYHEIRNRIAAHQLKKPVPVMPIRRWMVAASITLVLVIAAWLIFNSSPSTKEQITYLTKSTDRGQKLTFKLPDGSTVKLNAESTITYPETFSNKNQRQVTLSGEAFFTVVRNPNQPFTVQSGDLHTTVLGTSFNIDAYPNNSQIAVTVASGKVRVSHPTTRSTETTADHIDLVEAEQAQFNIRLGKLSKQSINLDSAMAWQDGILIFDGHVLTEIVPILERWYGVTITLKDPQLDLCHLRLTFDNLSLMQALEQLHLTAGIDYRKVEENVYEISGVGCKN